MKRVSRFLLLLLGLVLLASMQSTAGNKEWYALGYREESAGSYQVETFVDLAYAEVDGRPLRLDIFRPYNAAGPFPAVILVHGGAWRYLDHHVTRGMARILASNGFAAAAVEYRLSREAQWPSCLYDLKAAVRWLRANAKRYNLDEKRFAVLGDSAGGHLAAMLGVAGPEVGLEGNEGTTGVSSSVATVVAYYGVFDMAAMQRLALKEGPLPKLLGASYEERPELFREASPITYVDRKDPPMLLIHGLDDRIVPVEQSLAMEKALKEAGVEVELIQVQHADHMLVRRQGKPDPPLSEIDRRVMDFLRRQLGRI